MKKYTFKYSLIPNNNFKYDQYRWRNVIFDKMYLDMNNIISSSKIEEIIKIANIYNEGIIVVVGKDDNIQYIPNIEDENMIVINIVRKDKDNQQPSSKPITIKDIKYILDNSNSWISVMIDVGTYVIIRPVNTIKHEVDKIKRNDLIESLLNYKILDIKADIKDSGYGSTFSPDYYPIIEITTME